MKETLIGIVDEYLASKRTGIDMDLLEARIHLGDGLEPFTEDELVRGINETIDHYYDLYGLEQGREVERIINRAFIGEDIPPTR
jgi:hypothetical protein